MRWVIDDASAGLSLCAIWRTARRHHLLPLLRRSGRSSRQTVLVLGTIAVCSPERTCSRREHGRTLEVLARQIITATGALHQDQPAGSRRALPSAHRTRAHGRAQLRHVGSRFDPRAGSRARYRGPHRALQSRLRNGERIQLRPSWSAARSRKSSSPQKSAITRCACSSRRVPASSMAATRCNWRTRDGGMRRIAWTASALTIRRATSTSSSPPASMSRSSARSLDRLAPARLAIGNWWKAHWASSAPTIWMATSSRSTRMPPAILGHTPEEIVGTPLFDYIADDHKRDYEQYVSALNEQHEHQGLFYFKRPNGQSASLPIATSCCSCPAPNQSC